ncbi:MAG: hypothetical protein JSW61_09295 [Candidatus Thorarchaeota archaeon]|nr:MAG: hypothetical protein JSW61_09295 [Candidatus Thorarchaeota archaeon]
MREDEDDWPRTSTITWNWEMVNSKITDCISMTWPTPKLIAAQFLFYALGGVAAFFAWIMILTNSEALLNAIVGDYLAWHFTRWTLRLFFWGPLILLSAVLAFASSWLIMKSNRIGGYLGILAFLIGFVIDILVANIMFVHVLIGLLIGWVLLSPLTFGWDSIFGGQTDSQSD